MVLSALSMMWLCPQARVYGNVLQMAADVNNDSFLSLPPMQKTATCSLYKLWTVYR